MKHISRPRENLPHPSTSVEVDGILMSASITSFSLSTLCHQSSDIPTDNNIIVKKIYEILKGEDYEKSGKS